MLYWGDLKRTSTRARSVTWAVARAGKPVWSAPRNRATGKVTDRVVESTDKRKLSMAALRRAADGGARCRPTQSAIATKTSRRESLFIGRAVQVAHLPPPACGPSAERAADSRDAVCTRRCPPSCRSGYWVMLLTLTVAVFQDI